MFIATLMLAGALGTLSRYSLGQWAAPQSLPWMTLLINIFGSILMGAAYASLQRWPQSQLLLIFQIGFLGAFTTYSAYSLDTLKLFQAGRGWVAIGYLVSTPVLCVGACGLSYLVVSFVNQKCFSV